MKGFRLPRVSDNGLRTTLMSSGLEWRNRFRATMQQSQEVSFQYTKKYQKLWQGRDRIPFMRRH